MRAWLCRPHTIDFSLVCDLDGDGTIPTVSFAKQSVDIVVGFSQEAAIDVVGGGFLNVTEGELVIGSAGE